MKHIYKLSFLLIFIIPFIACEKIKDATVVDINTTMSVEIPVEVDTTSTMAKAALISYEFTQSHTESLEDNNKVNDYLDLLKKIEINEVNLEFSGIVGNQIIESIDIAVEGVGVIATIENIDASNLDYTPDVNSSHLVQIANQLYHTNEITVTVSGTTNYAPMTFEVNAYFDLHIEANPL